MAINIEYFLKQKYSEIQIDRAIKTEELYDDIDNKYIKIIFATLHQEINSLIDFMYHKTNGHFNANESRELIHYIDLYENIRYVLKDSTFAFDINKEYKDFFAECKKFLVPSGGSSIPDDLTHIRIVDYEPIFFFTKTVKLNQNNIEKRYKLTLVGEGSYAHVFKYFDEFYNAPVIIKRAKKNLTEKELERFKKEFITMQKLNSLYVLKVYRYDENNNEYYAEFIDETLYNYIIKNNSKISLEKRKNLVYQIFKAFSYIHSKGLLHRDISLTNILIKHYDNSDIIKISDFGLVKEKDSNLTSTDSDIKGSLNDSNLAVIGFKNYSIEYETYTLTRLILFVMTGKTNLEKITNEKIKKFVSKGISGNISERYKSIDEMVIAFKEIF